MSTDEQDRIAPPPIARPAARRFEGAAPFSNREPPKARAPEVAPVQTDWGASASLVDMMLRQRTKRRRRMLVGIGLFCVTPAILTFLYMLLIASPRYASKFEVTYQTYQPQQTLSAGLVQGVFGSSTGSSVDLSQILYEYIRSPSILMKLDHDVKLRQHYSDPKLDLFSRLRKNASWGTFLNYYRAHVVVSEGQGGYLTVTVSAFDPHYTTLIANAIVADCDVMVDDLTLRARQDEVRSAQVIVDQAQQQVQVARGAITAYQNGHSDLDPQTSASQLSGIVGTIEGDLAKQKAALDALRATAPRSPADRRDQHPDRRPEGADGPGAGPVGQQQRLVGLRQRLDEYSKLTLRQDLAKNAYTAAQSGLAVARADAASKQNYLIDFAPPYSPDLQNFWLAILYSSSVLVATLAVFGIGSLVVGQARG